MKAFPDPRLSDTQNNSSESLNNPDLRGMDLRDYFAGLAMQGLIASGSAVSMKIIAEDAYKMADRMMRVRNDR